MVYLPIIGAFFEAVGTILEKKVLKHRGVDYRNYTAYGFLAIVFVLLPVIYFFHDAEPEAFLLKNIGIFFFVVIVSVLANVLIFYSLKRENITEFEPVWLMQPLFTILLAVIVYSSERKWSIVALAFIASISLIAAHFRRHHFRIDRYMAAVYLGSFFFAVELVASKAIVGFYNPFFFYFLRCFFIFLLALAIFRPRFGIVVKEKKLGAMILLIAVLWAVYRAIIYYGYGVYGVVVTTLLFILSPVIMILLAVIFLHERPTKRQIISNIIMLACVIAAIIINQ